MQQSGMVGVQTCEPTDQPTPTQAAAAVRIVLRACRDRRLGPVAASELIDMLGLEMPGGRSWLPVSEYERKCRRKAAKQKHREVPT